MTRGLALAAAALVAAAAQAQDAADALPLRLTLSTEESRLDRGLGTWRQVELRLARRRDVRDVQEVALLRTRRFGLADDELQLYASRGLTQALTGRLQLTWSPTHRVLPAASVEGGLQYEYARANLLHAAWRYAHYDAIDVNRGTLALERYFPGASAMAGVSATHALGRTVFGGELRATRFYDGEQSSVGVIAAAGQEATQAGGGAVVLARVRSLALVGHHRFAPAWQLHYGLHRVRQAPFYTRTGGNLGVEHAF